MNWILVAVNALIIVGTIAYAEQDPNAGEGQMISKGIFSHILSKMNLTHRISAFLGAIKLFDGYHLLIFWLSSIQNS